MSQYQGYDQPPHHIQEREIYNTYGEHQYHDVKVSLYQVKSARDLQLKEVPVHLQSGQGDIGTQLSQVILEQYRHCQE